VREYDATSWVRSCCDARRRRKAPQAALKTKKRRKRKRTRSRMLLRDPRALVVARESQSSARRPILTMGFKTGTPSGATKRYRPGNLNSVGLRFRVVPR